MNDAVSPYALSLLRRVARTPAVLAVYTRTPVWAVSESDVDLVLVAEAGLAADLPGSPQAVRLPLWTPAPLVVGSSRPKGPSSRSR